MMTEAQFSKLPKYAQGEIIKQRRNAAYWEAIARREMTDGLTNTFIRNYGTGAQYRYQGLPSGATIWLPSTEDQEGPGITVRNTDGGVEVQCDHASRLHIEPVASNTVKALAVDRW